MSEIYNIWPIDRSYSFNKFIVESYKKEGLRSTERNGFAFVDQKISLKGLKLLVAATISSSGSFSIIPKGSTVYIKEEVLHTQQWAQKPLECNGIEGPFLIVDMAYVEFVAPPEENV